MALFVFNGWAQINTGTIVGTVTDPTGAVIPGVEVTVTNQETEVATTLITSDEGLYIASALRPGLYTVRAEMTGFKSAVTRDVRVSVADRIKADLSLQLGDIQEVVEVTALAQTLQTETASKGSVIGQEEIIDLPLDGRRYSDLILLSPGALAAPGQGSNPREARLNVDGNFSLQNYFALNGVDNNTYTTNAQERSPQAIQPPPDALQEFRIQTRNYNAEFGFSQGAVINAEIRTGTNEFHGSGFYFHRNDNLNANSFFANAAGIGKAEELRHQYGGLIGGPIIPDKTFFFADYQRTSARKGTTTAGTVPTSGMKNGVFTGLRDLELDRDAEGNLYYPAIAPCVDTVNDVLNLDATRTDGLPCGDPSGMMLAALYPEPNSGQFSFFSAPDIPLTTNSFDVRIDHNFNENNIIYGSYSFTQTETIVEQGPFPNPLATGGFTADSYLRGQLVSLTYNRIFSPTLLNSARFGFNRVFSDSAPVAPEGDAGPEFGLENLPGTFAYGLPPIRVSGYSLLGTSEWRPQFQTSKVFQFLDNLAWTKGNHSLKFGFEYKRALNDFLDIKAPNGRYIVSNQWTGDGLADLLLGAVQRVEATTALVPNMYLDGMMFYVQDIWKVSPKLTLNYGVRYEYFTPLQERDSLISNFDPTANGGRGALVTAVQGNIPVEGCDFNCVEQVSPEGVFGRSLVHPDKNNIAPRVGFSWQFHENAVLRGGYGIFYQAMDRIGSSAVLPLNPPQLIEYRGQESQFNEVPKMLMRDPFPEISLTFNPQNIDLRGRSMNEVAPYSQQYSFGPQFQFSDYVLDVSYVGAVSRKIRGLRPLNQGQIVDPVNGIITFPYPDWQRISDFLASDRNSNYNSLQIQLRRSFSNGFALNVSYTWSKALGNTGDNLSGGGASSQVRPQNAYEPGWDYGRLVFDQNHRLVANWVWHLPLGPNQRYLTDGPLAHVLGGWQFNGIWSSTSGAPVSVSASDRSGTRSQNFRADCIGNPEGPKTVEKYFNTDAFAQPANFTFGTCGVGVTSEWPHHVFDMSLFKNIPLPLNEESRLQFRTEFFNAFNTPQFGAPNTSVTSGNFGRTTGLFSSEKEARVIQFGLKFFF
jgi:hypothetical protein